MKASLLQPDRFGQPCEAVGERIWVLVVPVASIHDEVVVVPRGAEQEPPLGLSCSAESPQVSETLGTDS